MNTKTITLAKPVGARTGDLFCETYLVATDGRCWCVGHHASGEDFHKVANVVELRKQARARMREGWKQTYSYCSDVVIGEFKTIKALK